MAPKKLVIKTSSQSSATSGVRDAIHSYGTKRKSTGLGASEELTAKSYSPAGVSPIRSKEESIKSPLCEKESDSGNSSVAFLHRQSFASSPRWTPRTDSDVIAVNTTGSIGLEEQVAMLSMTVKTLEMGMRECDEQLDFVIKRLSTLSGKDNTVEEQNQ